MKARKKNQRDREKDRQEIQSLYTFKKMMIEQRNKLIDSSLKNLLKTNKTLYKYTVSDIMWL